MRIKLLVCILFLVCGCTTTNRNLDVETKFDPNDARFINETGTASISGQAFLNRQDGQVVYAAGNQINLIPATPYSRDHLEKVYEGKKFLNTYRAMANNATKNADPRYKELIRQTKADNEGRFTFDKLAPGTYFVQAAVAWQVGDVIRGGTFYETVTVTDGEQKELIMNGK
ncbi:MAG: carboxypeptidase regulatory-like domain-containing protein [Rhizobiaceae bacterium]